MTKGDAATLFSLFLTFAGFWVMGREAKQRVLGGFDGFQVAPKLTTSACRASKGGWSKSWATTSRSHSREKAAKKLRRLKGRYRGDPCVKFRITGG